MEADSGHRAEHDLIILGAGASGMTAALTAAVGGARALVLERAARVGGTSARSSGTVWIPDNPDMHRAGERDDGPRAAAYLDALVGARAPRALREAFLAHGPAMIALLESQAGMLFRQYRASPDYRQDCPGAAQGGRPLEPPEFDARRLGAAFDEVAWPIPELMLFGGMMVTRGEAARLLRFYKSADGALLGLRLVLRYLMDRLGHARGTRLVLGNALVAGLYHALRERGVPVWRSARALSLIIEDGRVCGVSAEYQGRVHALRARSGVVLAGGGFPASAELRQAHLRQPAALHTPAAESCVGETLQLGLAAGGVLGPRGEDNALWFPSSVAPRADGSTAVYPHIVLDRAKPGLVAVGSDGRRFTNEGASYHEFTRGMYAAHGKRASTIPAWLVCDSRFLWKYGLGMIRPMSLRLSGYRARGYLHSADTIAALARRIGVDPAGLAETVQRHAEFARSGVDADFGKGGNPYDLGNGDPEHGPNPCLGPIERAPFHAVRVEPTPLGTSLGLQTDAHARVLDAQGAPVAGLYAVGNDMHSPMGGEYPGAGAQLGPGMTFGYIAARHALQSPLSLQAT